MSVPTGYSPASQEDNINCTSHKYFFQESFRAPNHTKFSCKFTADMLQNCSGLVDPSFGFAEGKPCFIIKMNRVSSEGSLGDGCGVGVSLLVTVHPPVQGSRGGGAGLASPSPLCTSHTTHLWPWPLRLRLSHTN